ncbi:unnamed protein product [Allacma fusca]|uniref:Uncharacterized protein n=1 Tax=Allacma fusca TaxID=39272 RepID=A0A8J2JLL8_9HEXA|nr:unnamed protein product [Allacma fusca]
MLTRNPFGLVSFSRFAKPLNPHSHMISHSDYYDNSDCELSWKKIMGRQIKCPYTCSVCCEGPLKNVKKTLPERPEAMYQ